MRGLAIKRFTGGGAGIYLASSGNSAIYRNHIGTNPAGTVASANDVGIIISDCPNNDVGGTGGSSTRNIISGNTSDGVRITGSGASSNEVIGNYIGTDVNGATDLGNGYNGVVIVGAADNTVGGLASGKRNVISGNNTNGVGITGSGATNNQVMDNIIGLDATGSVGVGNYQYGVYILDVPGNTVGGSTVGTRNIISYNEIGVMISGGSASGNQIRGNYIGTNLTAQSAMRNRTDGVRIDNAPNNTIGGTAGGYRNVISGNGTTYGSPKSGVRITGGGAVNNVISANYIGTAGSGTSDLGNDDDGVVIHRPASEGAADFIQLLGAHAALDVRFSDSLVEACTEAGFPRVFKRGIVGVAEGLVDHGGALRLPHQGRR